MLLLKCGKLKNQLLFQQTKGMFLKMCIQHLNSCRSAAEERLEERYREKRALTAGAAVTSVQGSEEDDVQVSDVVVDESESASIDLKSLCFTNLFAN